MITASEARKLTKHSLEHPEKLSFFDKIQLRKIERHIRKAAKNGDYSINIHVYSLRTRVEQKLKEKGNFGVLYWRSRWSDGLRLIVSWRKD